PRAAPVRQTRSDDRTTEEARVWRLGDAAVPPARLAQGPARHPLRRLRPHRGAQDGAPTDRRIRGDDRFGAGHARPEQPRDGGADRRGAREHARLRPRQREERDGGEGARSVAARFLSSAGDRESRGRITTPDERRDAIAPDWGWGESNGVPHTRAIREGRGADDALRL